MPRQGPPLNLTNYHPDRDILPPNRATRRALAARDRKLARADRKQLAGLEARFRAAIAPLIAKPLTPEVRAEMIRVARRILGVTELQAQAALDETLKLAIAEKVKAGDDA